MNISEMQSRIFHPMLNKEALKKMLTESTSGCTVKFRKVNGEERIMWATLNSSLMPPAKQDAVSPNSKKKTGITESDDHVVVWDLEKNAWRSFRCDSIIMISREKIESQFQK
jgi:hypothetical protein